MIHRLEFKAMGCRMLAALESEAEQPPAVLSQVPGWFEEWEQSLSRFRENSELSLLNRAGGWPVQVSQTLWDVFQASLGAEAASRGLVTPTIFDALVGAGYDRDFGLLPHQQEARLLEYRPNGLLANSQWDASTRTICLSAGVRLDFGGIAKGWAADQAARRLGEYGPALVNAGGDIAISAPLSDGEGWLVSVEAPHPIPGPIELLSLSKCGVATSGVDYRRWQNGGKWNHHIIDPRSGHPAETDVVTATVIAPDAILAETAAKVALISGSTAGLAWVDADPRLAAILVLKNGQCFYNHRMQNYLWSNYEHQLI